MRSVNYRLGLKSTLVLVLSALLTCVNAMHPAPDRRHVFAPDSAKRTLNFTTTAKQPFADESCIDWVEAYRHITLDDVDTTKLIDIYTNIALLLADIENYDYAQVFLEKAYYLSDESNDAERLFNLCYERVRLDLLLGDFQNAAEDLKLAQKAEVRGNDVYRNMLLSEAYGLYYQAQGLYRPSIEYFQSALTSAREIGASERFSMLHLHFAESLKNSGLRALANTHLDSALQLVPPVQFNGEVRSCNVTRAEIFMQMGDRLRAKQAIQDALEVAREASNSWLEARFGLKLAKILISEKDYEQAYTYKRNALLACDSLSRLISQTSFKLYDQKIIRERASFEKEKRSLLTLFFQSKSWYTISFLVVTIVFGILFLFFSFRSYRRLREKDRILQLQRSQNAIKNSELVLSFAHTENLRTENQYKNEQQETARRSLLYKNSLIMNSIEYANTIQLSLRPHQDNMALRFPNHCIIYRPNNIVSGDLLWFADLPKQSIFILVDCSGHEVAGAALSFIAYMKLNEIVREEGITMPTRIIEAFATQFYDLWKNSTDSFKMQSNIKMGVLLIEHELKKAYFAGASQSLFYSCDGFSVKRYAGTMHTISLDTPFTLKEDMLEVELSEKTAFYMMTDGFIEQPDKDNIKIGSKKAGQFLTQIIQLPMALQRQKILAYFARHRIGMPQVDDMTILGVSLENNPLQDRRGAEHES